MGLTTTDYTILLSVVLLFVAARYLSPRSCITFPPGPKQRFVVGNFFDVVTTTSELWLRVTEWYKEFGDLCYLSVFGQSVLFLNTMDAASDLLDKRGAIYSDKPSLIVVGEMCGCNNMIPFMEYGEPFRRRRKLMQNTIGNRSIPKYIHIFEAETRMFIESLVSSPENYLRHIRRYSGGIALAVVYGYKVESSTDEYLLLAEGCMTLLANEVASGTGLCPVDLIPSLQYLPSWFPGAGFKRKAAVWRRKIDVFVDLPYENAKHCWASGTILPSFCSLILDDKEDLTPSHELDIKFSANSMYAASADTTISAISNFLLAMVQYPQAFVKAKREIEEVIGTGRLPTFDDRPHLPYIEAILNETWRWGCPVPLNLPHLLQEDDTYKGSFIPKGTIVEFTTLNFAKYEHVNLIIAFTKIIANMWAMSRDEVLYPNASEFIPDRFMQPDMTPELRARMDPRNYMFGFGRRRCPGADLIEWSNWLLVVTMCATLELSKTVDEKGNLVDPVVVYDNMFFRTPRHFKFGVKYSDASEASLVMS